jgi:hypothetical protein
VFRLIFFLNARTNCRTKKGKKAKSIPSVGQQRIKNSSLRITLRGFFKSKIGIILFKTSLSHQNGVFSQTAYDYEGQQPKEVVLYWTIIQTNCNDSISTT